MRSDRWPLHGQQQVAHGDRRQAGFHASGDVPWQVARQARLAIGPSKLKQALLRATLQPPFSCRDPELNRPLVSRTWHIPKSLRSSGVESG
jgi:hypothetical protein